MCIRDSYTLNQAYNITFDAGVGNTIDLSINSLEFEHIGATLYDRLGFQVSDDGVSWSNADVSGMIGTISSQLVPPWPGPLPTPNDGTLDPSILRGWIFPEFYSDFATFRAADGVTSANIYKIAQPHDTAMKRFFRFYFVSDTSASYDGWEIEIKPSPSSSLMASS